MTKSEFIKRLRDGLYNASYQDADRILDYYSEMIDDKIEDGMDEESAVENIGSIDDIIASALKDAPAGKGKNKKGSGRQISESFRNIHIESAECDIKLVPSNDGNCRIDSIEYDKVHHIIEVEGDTLVIKRTGGSRWYSRVGIIWHNMSITVYLPKREYDKLYVKNLSGDIEVFDAFTFNSAKIKTLSGDVNFLAHINHSISLESLSGDCMIRNMETESIDVKSKSGAIKLDDIRAKELYAATISGAINAYNVDAQRMDCKAVSGAISVEHCDGEAMRFKSVSGSIIGVLKSGKNFLVKSVSGSTVVPTCKEVTGVCEATTVSGSIKISLDYPDE